MKVVLLKEVKGLGHAWHEVDAADGHALNFLIPRKIAAPATPSMRKDAELKRKADAERKELEAKLVADRLASLADEKLVLKKKVNEKGHLYDGVDAKEIAELAKIPENCIKLERHIKEVGTHTVPVSFGAQFGKLTLVVEAE